MYKLGAFSRMNKEDIANWLASIGKDRAWLGLQLGHEKSTVDSWFSKRGFPAPALKSIERLMNPTVDKTAGLEVSFTASEWAEIEAAMKATGYTRRADFYQDAIIEKATEILAQEAKQPKVVTFPVEEVTSKVAEDSPPYGKSKRHKM